MDLNVFFSPPSLKATTLAGHSHLSTPHRGNPDLKWSPSTFWLMTYFTTPARTSPTRAMWASVGLASSNVTSVSTFLPCFSKVHTPFGPRKSGIPTDTNNLYHLQLDSFPDHFIAPAAVLIPAPVWTTTCCKEVSISHNKEIFSSSLSGGSISFVCV